MIEAEKATYPIKRMCELLEVSRSGFYKWRVCRDRGPTPAQQRRADVDAKVADFHKASDGVYGTPRILADLRADGERVSRKTVAASLRRHLDVEFDVAGDARYRVGNKDVHGSRRSPFGQIAEVGEADRLKSFAVSVFENPHW